MNSMDDKQYAKLIDLFNEDKVLIEVSKSYSSAVFGGKIGGFLFTILILGAIAGIIYFLFYGLYLNAIITVVALILFFIVWSKVAFYYFFNRSRRDYDFFQAAYDQRIIRLCIKDSGVVVSVPKPWHAVFDALRNKTGSKNK